MMLAHPLLVKSAALPAILICYLTVLAGLSESRYYISVETVSSHAFKLPTYKGRHATSG